MTRSERPVPVERSTEETHGDHDDHPLFSSGAYEAPESRGHRRHRVQARRQRRRRGLFLSLLSLAVVAVVLIASYVVVGRFRGYFNTPDYTGSGQGTVQVKVLAGDTTDDIAAALVKAGVVKSAKAFVNAASASGKASDIQPGTYKLPRHASGTAAMAAILLPASKLVSTFTIPEGYTYKQVYAAISAKTGLSVADLTKAGADVANLGITKGVTAKSDEGLLFPATYNIDPGTSASATLQTLVGAFNNEYQALDIAGATKTLNAQYPSLKLTPYDVIIIASIAESEAKFDADRAKVAQVIINRLASSDKHLRVDATSAYAAKLDGKAPNSIIYNTYPGPYNSYKNAGLPPTPIGNPGTASLKAAAQPTGGNKILYYVNIDAAGHLGFFSSDTEFAKAAAKCAAQGWGCG